MTDRLSQEARRLERHLFRAALCGEVVRHAVAGIATAAVAILLLRFLGDVSRAQACWAFLLLVPFLVRAIARARRRRVSRDFSVAWLDLRQGGDGRWLTRHEAPAGLPPGQEPEWREVDLPRLRRRPLLWPPVPALLFAAVVLWVEPSVHAFRPPNPAVEHTLDEVREKLASLEEVVDLEEETAAEVRERLERLQEQADSATPESALESADRLTERLEQEAERLAERVEQAQESLQASAAAAPAEPEAAAQETAETLRELEELGLDKGLPEGLAGLPSLADLPLGDVPVGDLPLGELADLLQGLTPEQMAQLAAALAQGLDAKLAALEGAGLLDPARLAELKPCTEPHVGGT